MKNILLGLLILIALLPSCSTDVNINAPYQDVTIVYGLLNFQDTVQYIRIEKGFIDKTKSALTLAQISDSIYYDTSILKVQLISLSNNNTINLTYTTQVPKDSGTFAYAPNILYKTNQPIDSTQVYKLLITNKKTGKTISSQCNIVQDFTVGIPSQDSTYSVPLGGFGTDSVPKQYQTTWSSAPNGVVYALTVRFYYKDSSINTSAVKDTFVDWIIFTSLTNANSFNITGNDFFHNLESNITVDPTRVRKLPSSGRPLEFRYTVGGQELYNYVFSSQVATSITALQAQTTYTDITNGIGIFSSRLTKNISNLALSKSTLDSLACGSITGNLGFSIPGTDCYK